MEIKILAKQGLGVRAISREVGCSRNTVRRYLREESAARYGPRAARVSKLAPYQAYITTRLKEAAPARIPAKVLLGEIRERGYEGGYTAVKTFVRGLRGSVTEQALVRFETEPGQQMQVDWAVIRRGADPLSVFVAVLGWSRATYLEFVNDERVETLIACHEHAFLAFGGIPREILYDNMKTVVIKRNAYGDGRHQLNAAFLDFAGHSGFIPRLCRPYRACTKGKVERFISYFRTSFWVPLTSRMEADGIKVDRLLANNTVARWLREVANVRIHATTGVTPCERLQVERAFLQPIVQPYGGISLRSAPPPSAPVIQHPLSVYDIYAGVPA